MQVRNELIISQYYVRFCIIAMSLRSDSDYYKEATYLLTYQRPSGGLDILPTVGEVTPPC